MRIRRFLWILSMISGLPLILVVGPVLGVWVIGRSWIQHWGELEPEDTHRGVGGPE